MAKDHSISLFGQTIALPCVPVRLNLADWRIALHHRMDGRLAVVYQHQVVGLIQPAQLGPPRLEQSVPTPSIGPAHRQ